MTRNASGRGTDDPRPHATTALLADERCKGCLLHGSRLCNSIRAEYPFGCGQSVLRRYGRGQQIVEQDASGSFLGVIRSGFVRSSVIRVNGERIILGLSIPGDIVGGVPGRTFPCDLEAATDVELCLYDRATVQRQMRTNPHFRRLIFSEMSQKHDHLLGSLWRYGTLNSRERIMAFLVRAVEIMPTEALPDGSLILRMEIERRDWADITNTAVETISRTLRHLEEKGLITSLTPYRFRIHNLHRMAALANVELPARQRCGRDRLTEGGASNSVGRMTAVNALAARPNRFDAVMKPVTASTSDRSGRRLRNGQEEIRN
ncbi:Crp/Fnr family transcriptional regulator [uncultured Martelella sp.]|uniref:Crp/Fnr family transcriptional regulator n=1 Tax=uncultured Martelella sp. TaxID=392331 RepID=UPI0029C79695|nr:Crp/Fnr family transcriptional regulator [uncultured Martelella sp.]